MKLAVEEINQSTDLLPNHVLGYKLFDSCGYPLTGQRAALSLLNDPSTDGSPTCTGTPPVLAVIGESSSSLSVMLSRILQPFQIPVVIMALSFLKKKKRNRQKTCLIVLREGQDIKIKNPIDSIYYHFLATFLNNLFTIRFSQLGFREINAYWFINCSIFCPYFFNRSAIFLHVLVSLTKGNTLISSE